MAEIEGIALEKSHEGEIVLRPVPLGESTQVEDQEADDMWTPEAALRPPEDLDALSAMSNESWVRSSVIEAMARNTVGLGYSIEVPPEHVGEDIDDKQKQGVAHTLDVLAQRDTRLNPSSFSELLATVRTDEEECGNGALEISREQKTGMIDGIFHAPGKRVRRLKDRSGYIIGPSKDYASIQPDAQRFYNFGDKVKYDDEGLPLPTLRPGRRWATNELLVFRLYNSASRDYGLPRDVELAVEYLAAVNLNKWMSAFFGGSGSLPSLLFVQGVETQDGTKVTYRVPQETIDRIQQAVRSGSSQGDRIAIIPLPPEAKAQMEKLSSVSDRDITFDTWTKNHQTHVLGSFRLGPIFVALESEGRYTAEVQRALGLEQVFDPEQRRYEDILNNTILPNIGQNMVEIKFKRLAIESDAARRDSADSLAEAEAITMGEYREAHGWNLLPEDKFGAGVNDKLISKNKPVPSPTAHVERTQAEGDQRGLQPGLAGRSARRGGGERAPAGMELAKENGGHDHADMPEYVEDAVSELAKEIGGE